VWRLARSRCSRYPVELGHEPAVGLAGGGEFFVAFVEGAEQVGGRRVEPFGRR
jgi:hypothetical protein